MSAIAYPWLGSAVTRDPVLLALLTVFQRLPWLLFTLPAGVITDRGDRRKLMIGMDVIRGCLTLVIAFTVLSAARHLPSPGELAGGAAVATNLPLYLTLLVSALFLGAAEVVRDNSAQTFLPAVVRPENLERANANLWGAEMVMNSFVGPPLGSLLLAAGFALPFFVDAGSFGAAAGLVFLIAGTFRRPERTAAQGKDRVEWRREIKEGFQWLWGHPVLRPMAVVLGVLNALNMMTFAIFVLFAQENLDLGTGFLSDTLRPVAHFFGSDSVATFIFSLLILAGAVGGVAGSVAGPALSRRLGSGRSLYLTILVGAGASLFIGLASRWWLVWILFAAGAFTGVLWNVITVSFRQTIIPDALLGRVNSVYRFFGWGMMPVGSFVGGVVVAAFTPLVGRSEALRWPFFIAALVYALTFLYAAPRLTTGKLEAARTQGTADREPFAAGREALAESGLSDVPPEDPEG